MAFATLLTATNASGAMNELMKKFGAANEDDLMEKLLKGIGLAQRVLADENAQLRRDLIILSYRYQRALASLSSYDPKLAEHIEKDLPAGLK